MFRIRKITNPFLEGNKQTIARINKMVVEQFPTLGKKVIDDISQHMINPGKTRSYSFLMVADDFRSNIRGFAFFMHMADLKICYLDLLAVNPGRATTGVGGSIYEKLREEAVSLKAVGIFFEALPDDPLLCKDPVQLNQNKKRLAFYEQYGAFPVINTKYEQPVNKGEDSPPYLVYDDLGTKRPLSSGELKKIIRGILQRKYPDYCPPEYIKMVVGSVKDNPVKLRPPVYIKKEKVVASKIGDRGLKIQLFVNNKHQIHHIKEVGYVESPVRVKSILKEITKLKVTVEKKVGTYPEKYILEIHDRGYVKYFKTVCLSLNPQKSVYPYVFPIRNSTRPPKDLSVRAGYYCIDTFTPLNRNAYLAARWGVNTALSGADSILSGNEIVYVLTRPPGHHAERYVFGGFCYFNNAAIAANYLSKYGRVAILDIDYHHGNGQQQIFYERPDVLTISVHGHPSFAYPYFSGFKEEKGSGPGLRFNYNYPLKEELTGDEYRVVLKKTILLIKKFKPDYLIVALGFDTAKGDPTGTWTLTTRDFSLNGQILAKLKLPTLFIQEGGYNNRVLGINSRYFFTGFYEEYIKLDLTT